MRRLRNSWIFWIILFWIAVPILHSALRTRDVPEPFTDYELSTENDMATCTTQWTSNGDVQTVNTTQLEGESIDALVARHKALVDAMKAVYPPD